MLDDKIGLHEEVRIIYVVDGYEAQFLIHDGDETLITAKGDTVIEALQELEKLMDDDDDDDDFSAFMGCDRDINDM